MKIILTGASGLLGRALMHALSNFNGFQVLGLAYSRALSGLYRLNLLETDAVAQFVTEHQPDVILHSAAERRPDVSENDPEATQALNVCLCHKTPRTTGKEDKRLDVLRLHQLRL